MNYHGKASVTVTQSDNGGWVLEWRDNSLLDKARKIPYWREGDNVKTSGIEVFQGKEALLARIAQLI